MTIHDHYRPAKRKQRESPLQDAILEYVRDYKIANDGNSPSCLQIARALGKNRQMIHTKVQRLATRGLISIDDAGKISLGGRYIPPDDTE